MSLDRLRIDLRHMRPADFVLAYGHKVLARIKYFDIIDVVLIEPGWANPDFAEPPSGVICRPLTSEEIRRHARDPELEWSEEFLAEALGKGDICFGAFVDGELANYNWYSTEPTAINESLLIRFDSRYAYAYKAYTLRRHRGRRFNDYRGAAGIKHLASRGKRGVFGYMSATNYPSVYALRRMGFRRIGRVFITTWRGRYVVRATRGCVEHGFSVEVVAPGRAPK